jgi:hypothetical protein
MSQKVLQISAEDAKYIDPNQVASLTMVDGSVIYVKGNEEDFVEEVQEGSEQYAQQGQQEQKQPALRGIGTNIAAGLATAAGVLGTAALVGSAISQAKRGPMMAPMGARPIMAPMAPRPVMAPMGPRPVMAQMGPRPVMAPMGPRPVMAPMGRFRARKQDTNEEVGEETQERCPYCNK